MTVVRATNEQLFVYFLLITHAMHDLRITHDKGLHNEVVVWT